MSPARHRLTLVAVGLGSAAVIAFVAWKSMPKTDDTPHYSAHTLGPTRTIVTDDEPSARQPEINADTGTPNLLYIKHGVAKGMAVILEALQSNDDKRVAAALDVTHEVLADRDLCSGYPDFLPSRIDDYMKVLIQQKRNADLESLALAAMRAFHSNAAFVALCETRRKLDPGTIEPARTIPTAAAKIPAAPALDADGIPNLAYVRNGIHPSLAILTKCINDNDEPKTARSLDLLTHIYADAQISRKDYAGTFTSAAEAWSKTLFKQKHYDLVEKLAFQTIRKFPFDGDSVEILQEYRVRARLAQGKPAEALILAKSLYNIASPRNARAIDLVAECLLAADPKSADAVNEFKTQQAAPTAPDAKNNLLTRIKVDPADYQPAPGVTDPTLNAFDGYMAKTHLLLLADKPTEARASIDLALKAATGKEIPLAAESNARTIKAEDAHPARAKASLAH